MSSGIAPTSSEYQIARQIQVAGCLHGDYQKSLAEQKEIVQKLGALSDKARALRTLQLAQSADLKALKQSILHEAFTGVK